MRACPVRKARLLSVGGLRTVVVCIAVAMACTREPGSTRRDSAVGRRDSAGGTVADPPVQIAIVSAADWIGSEWSEDAIYVGLQEEGFKKGRDFEFRTASAQGDLATLPSLIDQALDRKAKVIVALQDPTLKAALQRVKNGTPIVFHVLADPFAAGAGTSDSSHLPNVTGVYSPGFGDPEQEKRIDLIKRTVPKARRIGILYSPDEPYAVAMKDKMTEAGQRANLEIIAVPVSSVGEGGTATTALVGRKVDAIEVFGNSAHAAFGSIIQVARQSKVPVFSPSPFEMLRGATAAVYPDFQEGGVMAGRMIGRVLKGESPGKIPFYRVVTTKTSRADSARRP
jgi:ABC-type uncharacterized transport system substrate-binding protein